MESIIVLAQRIEALKRESVQLDGRLPHPHDAYMRAELNAILASWQMFLDRWKVSARATGIKVD